MSEKITLNRDNDIPLTFVGELIGEGESGTGGNSGYRCDWNRGTKIAIYKTEGDNYVVHTHHWSCWQGESAQIASRSASRKRRSTRPSPTPMAAAFPMRPSKPGTRRTSRRQQSTEGGRP
jgi:hypothetical protein